MKDIRPFLNQLTEEFSLALSPAMSDQFQIYLEKLLEVNQFLNLTAITDPDEVAVKHFLDSLLLLKTVEITEGASLADVGTGAGFPGVPLKIARPDIRVTLIDSLQKRLNFLQDVSCALKIETITQHGRAEDFGRSEGFRESFDVVTARAVANLNSLLELCLPLVRTGGYFAAFKSLKINEEIDNANAALSVLGGKIEKIETFSLQGSLTRNIVIIRKIASTPLKYPRRGVKIAKNPL